MITLNGTKHREKSTDFVQRCAKCGKALYFNHDCNGKWVICPYCGHKQ